MAAPVNFDREWFGLPGEQMPDSLNPVSELTCSAFEFNVDLARDRSVKADARHHYEVTRRGLGAGGWGLGIGLVTNPRPPTPNPRRKSERNTTGLARSDHLGKYCDVGRDTQIDCDDVCS